MDILETQNLTKQFGHFIAVDRLSITVAGGEIFGLLGPNGAGKSSVIKMLTTLLPPTSGAARIAGCDIVRQSGAVRHLIGYVPQLLSADGMLTGYENLLIFAKLYDIPRRQHQRRIKSALEFMGLADAADQLVSTYSGGMVRRLEIALSLLHRPQMLFLDEPTVGLDPVARHLVWDHITQLCCEYDTTIFLTTHSMEEADSLCDRVAILHRGTVRAVGSPDELKSSLPLAEATLDDVFVHYAGGPLEMEGGFREASRMRRITRRLG
jgi:ABC-2 type transport system ATP-binding protein